MAVDRIQQGMGDENTLYRAVCEIYWESVRFKYTHAEIMAAWTRLNQRPEYRRLPSYRRHSVRKIYEHLFHGPADMSIYQHLEYRLLYKGIYYRSFDQWRATFPDADASEIEQGKHFWKGTDKEY